MIEKFNFLPESIPIESPDGTKLYIWDIKGYHIQLYDMPKCFYLTCDNTKTSWITYFEDEAVEKIKTILSEKKEDDIKQVIVMRTEYINEKNEKFSLRKGKLISQGSHSSIMFLVKKFEGKNAKLSKIEKNWIKTGMKKICLQISTDKDILDLHKKASELGLESNVIVDSGLTEFHGEAKITCLAIGPDCASKIDKVTGHLKLY